jgi:hypothetical protein
MGLLKRARLMIGEGLMRLAVRVLGDELPEVFSESFEAEVDFKDTPIDPSMVKFNGAPNERARAMLEDGQTWYERRKKPEPEPDRPLAGSAQARIAQARRR